MDAVNSALNPNAVRASAFREIEALSSGRPEERAVAVRLEEQSISGLSGQQVVELLDTQAFFELLGVPYPTEQAGVLEQVVDERGVLAFGVDPEHEPAVTDLLPYLLREARAGVPSARTVIGRHSQAVSP
jgi:hypothetical protein